MIKTKDKYLTTLEAATVLGFTPDYIRLLIKKGKIKSERLGRNWIIDVKHILQIKRQRYPRTTKQAKEI